MNHSSPEIDHTGSPSRPKRERVRSFVKSIRRTSSQLFKKDKRDGDATPRNSASVISTLVSDTLGVSTAPTTPGILRKFSHSHLKHSTSVSTFDSDLSGNYLEVKVGAGGCIHSPIVEVATPISPAVAEPLDHVPMSPLEETGNEEDTRPETGSENPDPLSLPLPPSPLMEPVDPTKLPENPQEVDPFFHDDDPSPSEASTGSSSSGHLQHSATTDIALTSPPPNQTIQPSPAQPLPSASAAPGPDSDEDDEEMPELYIPALIAPTMFLPIPNVRLSYFFKPVLIWWLSKDILSYPYLYS